MERDTLKEDIKRNQKKRIDNGTIVKYKDGDEYFISPGFTTVKLSALKAHLKTIGMGNYL